MQSSHRKLIMVTVDAESKAVFLRLNEVVLK